MSVKLHSLSQKIRYYMSPFTQHSQNDKIRDREQISGCQGLGRKGVTLKGLHREFLCGDRAGLDLTQIYTQDKNVMGDKNIPKKKKKSPCKDW